MTLTVKDIIIEYLKKEGFDGLCNDWGECGCLIDDIEPWDCLSSECVPVYEKIEDDEESERYGEKVFTTEKPEKRNAERL